MFDYKTNDESSDAKSKVFPASTEALGDALAFVEELLDEYECPTKMRMGICVAIEEIFVNIARYAYEGTKGNLSLSVAFDKNTRVITFRIADKGIPFDPLKKTDPDITLPANDREVGGLGILITKKTMDTLTYAYEDGENILTMTKKI
jgi:anti-sigma regulatory factor (Ser/Thr protein kinase)